jgi:hypothetical protein
MSTESDNNQEEIEDKVNTEPPKSDRPERKPKSSSMADEGKLLPPLWLRKKFPDVRRTLELQIPPIKDVVKEAVVVLDANVLRMPFNLEQRSITEIARIYRNLCNEDRLWASSHTIREFVNGRVDDVKKLHQKVEKTKTELKGISNLQIPLLQDHEELTGYNSTIDSMADQLEKAKKYLSKLLEGIRDWGWRDPVSQLYREVFPKEKIVELDIEEDALAELRLARYESRTPPGYKDKAKDDGGVGDLLVWFELMEIGKKTGKPLLFITHETKTDWFERDNHVTLMPKIELLDEFFVATGKYIAFCSWGRFLQECNATEVTIEDVRKATEDKNPDWLVLSDISISLAVVFNSCSELIAFIDKDSTTLSDFISDWGRFNGKCLYFENLVQRSLASGIRNLELDYKLRLITTLISENRVQVEQWLETACCKGQYEIFAPMLNIGYPSNLLGRLSNIRDEISATLRDYLS